MWAQSGAFIFPYIVLNLNISFNFCDRLGFNFIWFVKFMKIRKPKIETISKKHSSFIDTIHCHFRTSVLKQLLILIESPNIFN